MAKNENPDLPTWGFVIILLCKIANCETDGGKTENVQCHGNMIHGRFFRQSNKHIGDH